MLYHSQGVELVDVTAAILFQGLALLTLSQDKNWDSHSQVNGYPSFYPRIALVAPSPGELKPMCQSAIYSREV